MQLLIEYVELFRGTAIQASVYPREGLSTSILAYHWHARTLAVAMGSFAPLGVGWVPNGKCLTISRKSYCTSNESTHLKGAMTFLFGYQSSAVDPLSA